MIITNKLNLPEAVYKVLAKDNYVKGEGDFSVTGILKSPRQVQLEKRYNERLEEDASDRVWSLLGNAAHNVLESHAADEAMAEERLYIDILGAKIGGQVDHYHDGIISDYKVTSVYSLIYGSKITDWTLQLNTYAKIFRYNGYNVRGLQIVTILRDWNRNKVGGNYPPAPIQVIPITLMTDAELDSIINPKIEAHIKAKELPDDKLPYCTSEETWESSPKYAVMKKGRKTAIKLFDDEDEAVEYCEISKDYFIIKREGERRKCKDYCPVAGFCNQYQEYLNERDKCE